MDGAFPCLPLANVIRIMHNKHLSSAERCFSALRGVMHTLRITVRVGRVNQIEDEGIHRESARARGRERGGWVGAVGEEVGVRRRMCNLAIQENAALASLDNAFPELGYVGFTLQITVIGLVFPVVLFTRNSVCLQDNPSLRSMSGALCSLCIFKGKDFMIKVPTSHLANILARAKTFAVQSQGTR